MSDVTIRLLVLQIVNGLLVIGISAMSAEAKKDENVLNFHRQ